MSLKIQSISRYWRIVAVGICLGIGLFLTSSPSLASGETLQIADDAALRGALAQGVTGKTLVLAPGQYSPVRLRGEEGTVPAVITSADPDQPAEITGLDVRGFSGLRLSNLHLRYRYASGDKIWKRSFDFRACNGLEIVDSRIEGDEALGTPSDFANGRPFGVGLFIEGCSDVTITGLHVSRFHRGMKLRRVSDVMIRDNELTRLRSDGMNLIQVEDVRIEGNMIYNFDRALASPDHADMIQFWTEGTDAPTQRVTIRDNILHSGSGFFTQSIFMRNEEVDKGRAGLEMFYRDITIEENVIINAHLHGISVGETNGLKIQRNTLIHNPLSVVKNPQSKLWVPTIGVKKTSRNVEISHNVTNGIRGEDFAGDWSIRDNLIIQDDHRLRAGFYGHVFVGMPGGDPLRIETYFYRSDGPAGIPGLGASRLRR